MSKPYPNSVPSFVDGHIVRNDDPALARDMNAAYVAGLEAAARAFSKEMTVLLAEGLPRTADGYVQWGKIERRIIEAIRLAKK